MTSSYRRVLRALNRAVRIAASPAEVLYVLRNKDIGRGHPRYARWVRRIAAIEVLTIVVLAILAPVLLIPLALVALILGSWFAWQSRDSRGRDRHLPPGSLGVRTRMLGDPDFFHDQIAKHGPVSKTNQFEEPLVCIAGVDRATRLFKDHHDDLRSTPMPWNRYIPGGIARWMDKSIHAEYRRVLSGSLGARPVRNLQDAIDDGVERGLGAMAEASASSDGSGFEPLPHLHEMMFEMWADVFFAIRPDDSVFDEFQALYEVISIEKQQPGFRVEAALTRLEVILVEQYNAHESDEEPRPSLLREIQNRQPDALERITTLRNMIYLMETSSLDVTGLLNWMLKHAVDNPEWLDALRNAPLDLSSEGVAGRMFWETLRLEQSEDLYRRVANDFTFEGFVLPKDWMVRACIHESHRDPEIFEDPDAYDPDRFERSTFSPREFSPFGVDGRSCLGVGLTRTVATAFMSELVRRFDVQKISDGDRQFSRFRHWAPSSDFHITIVDRHETSGARR